MTSVSTTSTTRRKLKIKVLSTKVSLEDYTAYKISAEHLFHRSISEMLKTVLRFFLYEQGINDKKFEKLKIVSKSHANKINDSYFIARLISQSPKDMS